MRVFKCTLLCLSNAVFDKHFIDKPLKIMPL